MRIRILHKDTDPGPQRSRYENQNKIDEKDIFVAKLWKSAGNILQGTLNITWWPMLLNSLCFDFFAENHEQLEKKVSDFFQDVSALFPDVINCIQTDNLGKFFVT